MRKVGKVGPLIPCKVQAQTRLAQAIMPVVRHRRCQATTSVGTRARIFASRRQRLHPGDNVAHTACVHDSGVIFYKLLAITPNVCTQATTSALGRRRLPHAFMSKAGFACPNCEYDKKEFFKPVQKIGNLKINPPMEPVHLKSTCPENRFQ